MIALPGRALVAAVLGVAVVVAVTGSLLLLRHRSEPVRVRSESGDLMRLVRRLVDEMPRPDTHAYHSPTEVEEQRMSSAFRSIESGDLNGAAERLRKRDELSAELASTGRLAAAMAIPPTVTKRPPTVLQKARPGVCATSSP